MVLGIGAAAQAEDISRSLQRALDNDPAWDEWSIITADEDTLAGDPQDVAALLLEREDVYVLAILKNEGQGYEVDATAIGAIYQDGRVPVIRVKPGEPNLSIGSELSITYTDEEAKTSETYRYFSHENRRWSISSIMQVRTLADALQSETSLSFHRMYIDYTQSVGDEHTSILFTRERVFGKHNRALDSFNIYTYARTLEEAGNQPNIPSMRNAGQQPDALPAAQSVTLDVTEKVAVLTGPGNDYLQIDDAYIKRGTKVEAIALHGNYALVAYKNGREPVRYGYIPQNTLQKTENLPHTQYQYTPAYVQEDTPLVDSPKGTGKLGTVRAGDELVYLASLGSEWTLVEVPGLRPIQGLVRSDALLIDYGMDTRMDGSNAAGGSKAMLVQDTIVIDDPYRSATPETVATVFTGMQVLFLDSLYGEWAYIEVQVGEAAIRGFVPRDAVVSMDHNQLEANG